MSSQHSLLRQNTWAEDNFCANIITDSTSSLRGAGDGLHKSQQSKSRTSSTSQAASPSTCSTYPRSTPSSSSFSQMPSRVYDAETLISGPPNLCYEMNVAKSILQQYSTISGNNLYDHLADIIKRVLDERPPNVIDFFEEFSRNVREQKVHLPERIPLKVDFDESRLHRTAREQLKSMNLPYDGVQKDQQTDEALLEETVTDQVGQAAIASLPRITFNVFNQRLQKLQFYWNQCGFSISNDDTFLLATSMDRLQTHPSIMQCRFWGVINGLRASYYIVEAILTKEHVQKRLEQMEDELREKFEAQLKQETMKQEIPQHIGPEFTPGYYGWENVAPDLLAEMQPRAVPIPVPRYEEIYDIPPEMIGTGLNRFSYFVVNSLSDDWLELPIVTPKQIKISRRMKKFFTGDLEAELNSYPSFPGEEKHYLRAMIARITCGTTIAPKGYYRKMTRMERFLYEADEDDENEEEEEDADEKIDMGDEGEGEEEDVIDIDNDLLPVRNEKYKTLPVEDLKQLSMWVHIRPNVLKQGRIVWFDEMLARKERIRELRRMRKLSAKSERVDPEDENASEEGSEEEEESDEEEDSLQDRQEYGPPIFSRCSKDSNDEFTIPWVSRFTSHFTNKIERILVMRSNTWPGSYTFATDELCETVYMGWGHKYVSRNLFFEHLPNICKEFPHGNDDFIETTDPSLTKEKDYIKFLTKTPKGIQFADLENFEEEGEEDYGSEI